VFADLSRRHDRKSSKEGVRESGVRSVLVTRATPTNQEIVQEGLFVLSVTIAINYSVFF